MSSLPPDVEAVFEQHRGRLFGIAYRLLGSVADAEDACQDAWLAWSRVDPATVEAPQAYLTRTITNLCLNQRRGRQRRREDYVGPWLPEPIDTAKLPDEAAELADSVTFAMLVLLESLSPRERAAFVLREVFDVPTQEIATALASSPAAVRQLLSRARARLAGGAPRYDVDPLTVREVTGAFVDALRAGDVSGASQLLAPDVELLTDGGGRVSAALHPIHGPARVLAFLAGLRAKVTD
ncbi:MAG: sigma-70 family RNA polymerase sigma factor, partial [Austwickia sp.]|nr:sigma-70 family RNA polymerase sigma factor [Austwickia sp.]